MHINDTCTLILCAILIFIQLPALYLYNVKYPADRDVFKTYLVA